MTPVEVVLISGSFTLVGSVLAWFLARLQKNADRKADSSTPGTPTVQEIWKRQDGMENAFKASLVLLAEAVEQHNDPGSIQFNDTAVKTLRASGYMPPELENVLKKSTEEGGNP